MVGNWQNSFGGASVSPAQASFEPLDLTVNTALVWSLEASEGTPVVAALMAVTPSAIGLSLAMPDATQGATGIVSIIYNPGNATFNLTDTNGALVVSVAAGAAWVISLTDNGTPAGTWLALQLGALTSAADAGQLAGYGLQALSTKLQSFIQTSYFNTNELIDLTYRASGIVWQGASAGNFQLDLIANLTAGWWALFTNEGTEEVTITASSGNTINGVDQITLPPGGSGAPYSVLVVAASDGFNTFAGTPAIIPISGGGTGADNAPDALTNFGGSTIGIEIFEAPNAAAILALLGIGAGAFTELTVAANQILTPSSANDAYVCTAALQLSLPDTTTLTDQYLFAVYAQAGNVTFAPQPSDKINGGVAGANFVIPKGASLIMVTDAATNWWPLFLYQPGGIPWTISGGAVDAITAAYIPANMVLSDGLVVAFRAVGANVTTAPTLNVDGLGPKNITKDGGQPLVPKDIPGVGAECIVRYAAATTSWELYNPTINLDLIGAVQGDILFRDVNYWNILPPGTVGQVLTSSYINSSSAVVNPAWANNSGRLLSITKYVANGSYTYTVPAGCASLYVEAVGAGGGGAGAAVGASQYVSSAGGGGGAGAFTSGVLTDHAAGDGITVTIGAGGVGGAGANNGNNGNNTSFGSDLIVNGGVGGVTATPNVSAGLSGIGSGGAGGTVSTAGSVLSVVGDSGDYGIGQNKSFGSGGNGGAGPWGGSGLAGTAVTIASQIAGGNGGGPGAGGGGAGVYSNGASQTANGGNGADGGVIIYAYT